MDETQTGNAQNNPTQNNSAQTDVQRLEAKVDQLTALVAKLVERDARQAELLDEVTPIAREVMDWATVKLDGVERAGWFAMGREALGVVEAIVEAYEPEDVRALGQSMVTILEAVRAFTQPEVMALLAEAGEALQHGDELAPATPLDVLKAGRDPEVQRGLAVMVEVLRQVGRATKTLHPNHSDADAAKERHRRMLSKRMAPTGGYRVPLGARPAADLVRAAVQRAAVQGADVESVDGSTPCEVPLAAKDIPQVPGFELTAEGYLADPGAWTEDYARAMAAAMGVAQLTEGHWQVIRFARRCYLETESSPNIRAITAGAGVSTKELYALWPAAPGTTTARVAGVPKPVGCI